MTANAPLRYEPATADGVKPLGDEELRLWCVGLRPSAANLAKLAEMLSSDERERAERYRFAEHRQAFVTARGFLRLLLSHFTGVEPEGIEFAYGERGKPALLNDELRFNVSHSGDLALYAFTRSCEVGVDIEKHREMSDLALLARRFFAPGEVKDLLALPAEQQPEAFFRCWTRKEAYVKAIGDGLHVPLDSFRVSLRANEPAKLMEKSANDTQEWALWDVTPCVRYTGAVAAAGRIGPVEGYWAGDADRFMELAGSLGG